MVCVFVLRDVKSVQTTAEFFQASREGFFDKPFLWDLRSGRNLQYSHIRLEM